MAVFQGFPPWPPSVPDQWPQYGQSATPWLVFHGPAAPVPSNAGGPGNTIVPGWNLQEQTVEQEGT